MIVTASHDRTHFTREIRRETPMFFSKVSQVFFTQAMCGAQRFCTF